MRYLLIGGLVALVAIVGGSTVLGRRLPGPLGVLSRTGLGFLLLGILMGPTALDAFDRVGSDGTSLRSTLEPITALAMAWIGVLYGCHLEWARMRRFGAGLYVVTAIEGTAATVAVCGAAFLVLCAWTPARWSAGEALAAAAFCGAAASGTAPTGLFLLREEARMSGPIYERLLFFSALDDLPGLVVLAVLFAVAREDAGPGMGALGWLATTVATGYALSWLLRLLLRPGLDREGLFVGLLGVLALAAGLCGALRLSPLVVGVVAGCAIANSAPQKERIFEALQSREHTLYVVFLVLVGSLVRVEPGQELVIPLLIGALMVARLGAKVVGVSAPGAVGLAAAVPARAGLALLPQGGMTIAMAASFADAYPGPAAQAAAAATVLAVFLNDLLGAQLAPPALAGLRRG